LSHDNRWAGRQGPVPRRPFPVPDALLQDSGRRRFTEFLMPASVILAGVLVVVAFGFIINRAMDHQDDNDAGQLPLPPPAFTVPSGDSSDDSSDQAVIPIPSEPSSASPSTTRPTEPPPTSRTRPPQEVVIERGAVPSLVNLSAEGDRDWVHWGQQNKFSLERDSDGDFQILEGAPKAPRFRHEKSPQRFSWRGGSPVESTDGVSSTRVLRLYVGVQAARGRLEAKLSAGGDADTATLENRDGDLGTAVFTVTYRSSRDGKLNLSWITAESFSDDCGGVALEAATLR
jgi:hypothetical protein